MASRRNLDGAGSISLLLSSQANRTCLVLGSRGGVLIVPDHSPYALSADSAQIFFFLFFFFWLSLWHVFSPTPRQLAAGLLRFMCRNLCRTKKSNQGIDHALSGRDTWLAQSIMFLVLACSQRHRSFRKSLSKAVGLAIFLSSSARPMAVWLCLLPFEHTARKTLCRLVRCAARFRSFCDPAHTQQSRKRAALFQHHLHLVMCRSHPAGPQTERLSASG